MSSPERYTLHLSRQVERDIEDILQYTHETYGDGQRRIYAAALDQAFATITGNPGLGHRRPDLSNRHRALNVEQHVVVYTVSGQHINVCPCVARAHGFCTAYSALTHSAQHGNIQNIRLSSMKAIHFTDIIRRTTEAFSSTEKALNVFIRYKTIS